MNHSTLQFLDGLQVEMDDTWSGFHIFCAYLELISAGIIAFVQAYDVGFRHGKKDRGKQNRSDRINREQEEIDEFCACMKNVSQTM